MPTTDLPIERPVLSNTHKYIPRRDMRQENLFLEEYYSSTDVKIYIDDEEQTEIGYISYSILEQIKPLYGYDANTYDDISIGNRIVTGTLKIPIKNITPQSQLSDIKNNIKEYNNSRYNDSEQANFDNTEWVNPQSNNSKQSNYSDNDKSYLEKLATLGYSGSPESVVKDYQYDNKIVPTGILNSETKNSIDLRLDSKNKTTHVSRVTQVYLDTDTRYKTFTISPEDEIIILNEYDGGWSFIEKSSTGQRGYVRL